MYLFNRIFRDISSVGKNCCSISYEIIVAKNQANYSSNNIQCLTLIAPFYKPIHYTVNLFREENALAVREGVRSE